MELTGEWFESNATVFKGFASRQNQRLRMKRYTLAEPLFVFARPPGMRCYSFNLRALNLSASGFYLEAATRGFVPFRVGALVHATVDLSAIVFERPLHMILQVARVCETPGNPLGFGVHIISVEESQRALFWRGLTKFGAPDAME